jgi:hypothetical protein
MSKLAKKVGDIARENGCKVITAKEYKKPVCVTKKDLEDALDACNPKKFEVVVSDQIKPGTVYVSSDPEFIGQFKARDPFDLPLGVELKWRVLKRREPGAKIEYNTDIDVPFDEPCCPESGATCGGCGEFYEYAVACSDFKCWGCKNGY